MLLTTQTHIENQTCTKAVRRGPVSTGAMLKPPAELLFVAPLRRRPSRGGSKCPKCPEIVLWGLESSGEWVQFVLKALQLWRRDESRVPAESGFIESEVGGGGGAQRSSQAI
ncbi:hypothetical protein PBY51_006404 [Eleginops maclovinus]|uniref:Uncharacterized protein n=1 Tax=Eleginops maclovinus TaxID=56733 RepID=A0AAN8A4H9_ELEMC|nr:hypothetical protein PBY51_006404 [Eleginops maclovinus]